MIGESRRASVGEECWLYHQDLFSKMERSSMGSQILPPDIYQKVRILEINHAEQTANIRILASQLTAKVKLENLTAINQKSLAEGYTDLSHMQHASEPEILFNLKNRFLKNCFYTQLADTLIFINPHSGPPADHETERDITQAGSEAPHIDRLAEQVRAELALTSKSQQLCFLGENGAGKSENLKTALT